MQPEFFLDIFSERMNLQTQVSTLHGIRKFESHREFVAETPVTLIAQEFTGIT